MGVHWTFPPASAQVSVLSPEATVVIGRDSDCAVVTSGREASRRHAHLALREGSVVVRDLRSLNGTFVNGRRIDEATLKRGDVLRIGELVGIVTVVAAESDLVTGVQRIADGLWAGRTLRVALEPTRRLSSTTLPLLLQGETGSGKERVARAIHEWSGRKGPFVAVNCAAIPHELAEAELFGYRKGAFTGAEQAAVGHFRSAQRGTLLLDEVAELPLTVQAKLLRVLEQGELQQLGESKALAIDVRVIAASLASLPERVAEGTFRADLYARLNGSTITLPNLAQRKDEIVGLFMELLSQHGGDVAPAVDAQLIERLLTHAWPGNVRELQLLVRRLLGLHGHEPKLRVAHLDGTSLSDATHAASEPPLADGLSREQRDINALIEGLQQHNGNLTKAAAHAKISRQRAYRLVGTRPELNLELIRKNGA